MSPHAGPGPGQRRLLASRDRPPPPGRIPHPPPELREREERVNPARSRPSRSGRAFCFPRGASEAPSGNFGLPLPSRVCRKNAPMLPRPHSFLFLICGRGRPFRSTLRSRCLLFRLPTSPLFNAFLTSFVLKALGYRRAIAGERGGGGGRSSPVAEFGPARPVVGCSPGLKPPFVCFRPLGDAFLAFPIPVIFRSF